MKNHKLQLKIKLGVLHAPPIYAGFLVHLRAFASFIFIVVMRRVKGLPYTQQTFIPH